MPSRRILKLIAALEAAGNTNVKVRWEPLGAGAEMCGQSGGYFFTSKQHDGGVNPLGTSLDMALRLVAHYEVR